MLASTSEALIVHDGTRGIEVAPPTTCRCSRASSTTRSPPPPSAAVAAANGAPAASPGLRDPVRGPDASACDGRESPACTARRRARRSRGPRDADRCALASAVRLHRAGDVPAVRASRFAQRRRARLHDRSVGTDTGSTAVGPLADVRAEPASGQHGVDVLGESTRSSHRRCCRTATCPSPCRRRTFVYDGSSTILLETLCDPVPALGAVHNSAVIYGLVPSSAQPYATVHASGGGAGHNHPS
jgi:hypothetical protein